MTTATGNPRQALADAAALETAAEVIRRRARDPRGVVTLVPCKALESMARRIRGEVQARLAGSCSSGCPAPPEGSRASRTFWRLYSLVTWPYQVMQFKRAGFRRTGWMTWETGPDDVHGA
jgi:hypothetical protein